MNGATEVSDESGLTTHEVRELNIWLAERSRGLPAQVALDEANAALAQLVAERAEVRQRLEDALVVGSF